MCSSGLISICTFRLNPSAVKRFYISLQKRIAFLKAIHLKGLWVASSMYLLVNGGGFQVDSKLLEGNAQLLGRIV
jgi:hypothetical protein